MPSPTSPYPAEPDIAKGELPDPFAMADGGRVAAPGQWAERSRLWLAQILDLEYGGLPPEPDSVEIDTLCQTHAQGLPGTPSLRSYRVRSRLGSQSFSFCARALVPEGSGPFPAIVNGDGCWWYLTDAIAGRVIENGCALVLFNRTEIAADLGRSQSRDALVRQGGLPRLYPDAAFGALSAWAWGHRRCVDLLRELPYIRQDQIAINGHSRGGKATLIAGAADPRVALVNDNASCAGGAAAFRYVGAGGEDLAILDRFPSWFGPGLRPYLNKEEELPFDQHCLLAAVAPRPLLLTYAADDRWSNPEGMVQCAWAAKEVYRFLGAEDDLAFHFRAGGHAHAPEDWEALLDFIDWKWRGQAPESSFNQYPYPSLKPLFSWRAPDTGLSSETSPGR